MAYRALRDTIALQLTRRGFHSLRQNALSLLTELAASFIRALGVQLQQCAELYSAQEKALPLVPLVVRLQSHTNVRSAAEWRRLRELFQRRFEPLHGAAVQVMRQKQPHLGVVPIPHNVEQLYVMGRASSHYKTTATGRLAHAQAGAGDVSPMPVALSSGGAECEVLYLKRKHRRAFENWLSGLRGTHSETSFLLMPGAPTAGGTGEGFAGQKRRRSSKGERPSSESSQSQSQAHQRQPQQPPQQQQPQQQPPPSQSQLPQPPQPPPQPQSTAPATTPAASPPPHSAS